MDAELPTEDEMKYPGAEIKKKADEWWIEYDFGEAGPFPTYEAAAAAATPNDEPVEYLM